MRAVHVALGAAIAMTVLAARAHTARA